MVNDTFQILAYFILLLCFIPLFVLLKGSPFDIQPKKGLIWSLLIYKDVALIVIPVFVLVFADIVDFNSLSYAEPDSVFSTSVIILFSLLAFYLSLFVFYKSILSKAFITSINLKQPRSQRKIYIFSMSFILSGCVVILISILFLDYNHAFLRSVFFSESLLSLRLRNVYNSSLPTQFAFLITMSWWVASIFASYLLFLNKRLPSLLVLFIGFLICTTAGEKAPIIQYIIIFLLSCLYFYRPSFSWFKWIVYAMFAVIVFSYLIYYVVLVQYPDFDIGDFLKYLISRLGVGQMAGTYETLSLRFVVSDSWWHMIPFASFFVDYPVFSKELMLYTEGAAFTDTGVKNSFFISEAFGMGGYYLMLASPVLMAFAFVVKIILIKFILSRFFGSVVANVFTLPIVFMSTSLTGDLSSMVFQKGSILILFILALVYGVSLAIKLLMVRPRV